jgi:hypothetical protein
MPEVLRFDWTNKLGVTRALSFYFVESYTGDKSTTVTRYPREKGADAADHARNEPDGLTFVLFVSNAPTDHPDGSVQTFALSLPPPVQPSPVAQVLNPSGALVTAAAGVLSPSPALPTSTSGWTPPAGRNFVREMIAVLDEIREGNEILIVSYSATGPFKGEYALTKITEGQDYDAGDGMNITVELQRVEFADVQLVPAPKPAAVKAAPKTNKGQKGTEKPTPQREKSWLKSGADIARETVAS